MKWKPRFAFRKTTLLRSLFLRYGAVIGILLIVIGIIQVESLQQALVVAGQSNLSFALRDAINEQNIGEKIESESFASVTKPFLTALHFRGVNVRVYTSDLRNLGERKSSYDPEHLVTLTKGDQEQILASKQAMDWIGETTEETEKRDVHVQYIQRFSNGQILLMAAVFVADQNVGFVELGYQAALFFPILLGQSLLFFGISIIVLFLAAALLFPVLRAPIRPIHSFMKIAERIRKGAFQERFPIMGPLDTEQLAFVMNDALDQLARAVEVEQKSTQQMKQFVAAASHELRTPLTAIRGFTEVLLRRIDDYEEEIRELPVDVLPDFEDDSELDAEDELFLPSSLLYREQLSGLRKGLLTMEQETSRLETLVKDLLQLARLDGGIMPDFHHDDLAAIVKAMEAQLDVLAGAHQIGYELDVAVAYCDRSMIRQIVYNLTMNALQYTTKDSDTVVLRSGDYSDSQFVFLSVTDTGPGMTEEQKSHIFERFYRASQARERNPGGAGLGLAIVDEIVKAHQGFIQVKSQLGVGTTMMVILPKERIE